MANLDAIKESQRSNKDQNTLQSFGNFSTSVPQEGERKYVIFKLVKKRKGRVYIDGRCDGVANPKTKKTERIWLLNGVDSIWQSDLKDFIKDREWVKQNISSLIFEDGVCRIRVEDQNRLEYAQRNKNNVGKNRTGSGKWDYFEYDPQEEAKARLDRENTEIKMMMTAQSMDIEKAKRLAAFFNIRFVDDLGMYIGDDGVKTELIRKAKQDPYLFGKYIDSVEVEVSWMVKKAIIDAKIDLGGQPGNAVWANGKGFIAKIPSDRKPYEYLTELAMTNSEEGKKFKEQLQTFLN
jgi:hypothetical protein